MSEKPSFVVRGHDIDRTGTVPPSGLLRFLESARWEMLDDPEFRLRRFFDSGHRMVVRVQKLEIRESARFGDRLEVTSWVARVGRTSLDIAHRILASDGREVARGLVVGVHLDPAGAPHPIPDDVRALVKGGELPAVTLELGPRPRDPVVLPLVVRPSDIDLLQHVNQARYADYFDDARALAAQAGSYGARRWAGDPCRRLVIDHAREARLGDRHAVHTWGIFQEPRAFAFELWREGDASPLARARIEV